MSSHVCHIPVVIDHARELRFWRERYRYYYSKLEQYLRFVIPAGQSVLMLGCADGALLDALRPGHGLGVERDPELVGLARQRYPHLTFHSGELDRVVLREARFEYIVLNDMAGQVHDLVDLFQQLAELITPTGRVVVLQHSYLWRPIFRLAAALGLKRPEPPQNWLSPGDLSVLLHAAGLETVQITSKLFMPINPLGVGAAINATLGVVPFLKRLGSTQLIIARPALSPPRSGDAPSCTICLTTRDERDNIEPLVRAIPAVGRRCEILFVEGHSVDGTRDEIQRVMDAYPEKNIRLVVQQGSGQGDAIRLGFREARGDIVILLEADQTSPPADVIKVFNVLAGGRADYVNGSRFIYPTADGAIRPINLFGNMLFALWFHWFLGQRTSDVLCGIKGITRRQYEKLYANWGFLGLHDPFGDFELIFGAARLGLRICEVPTHYYPRRHGTSKTRVLKHGLMLARMALAATWRFKCT